MTEPSFSFEGIKLTRFNRMTLDGAGHGVVWVATRRAARRGVKYARQELDRAGTNDTGALSASLDSRVEVTPFGPRATIYSRLPPATGAAVSYASFVNDGTAGDGAGYIYPQSVPVFAFPGGKRSSGASIIYAPRVHGQKGTHFMEKALSRIRFSDFN